MEKIISLIQVLSALPWKKIIAIACFLIAVAVAFFLFPACSVSRKIETYGVTEKNYVSYDTICVRASKKIPKNFVYEP